jgi:hypothetical protein
MALKILQSGVMPLGQFDGLSSILTKTKGGEVVSFTYVTAAQQADAADFFDGYVSSANQTRPVVTYNLTSGMRPLFLCDDGTTGYGTLFGVVVGGSAGTQVNGPSASSITGAILGPHTATGSGKLTLWDKPGLYAVTLDAVDTTASTGLVPSNTTISGGAALYATTAGLLTPNVSAAFEAVVVGRFLEFAESGGRVETTLDMVSGYYSPSNQPTAQNLVRPFTRAVFSFWPGL